MKLLMLITISSLICLSSCGKKEIITIEDFEEFIRMNVTTTTTTTRGPRVIQQCPYSDNWRNEGCNGCRGDPCRFDKECCFGICNYVTASCYGPNRTHGTAWPVNPNTPPRIF